MNTSSDDATDGGFVRAAGLDDLETAGRLLVNRNGQAIALFSHEGSVYAVDNRCPHMGFPLTEGTVEDGILTCHWHHARFELGCGDTFDPWADDVPTYPVRVEDGEVYVRPEPRRDEPPADHWRARLRTGLRENLRLVLAKAAVGLDDAGVPYAVPFREGLEFGVDYRESGWGPGLTVHTAMANLQADLDAVGRRRALYRGLLEVADDAAGSAPRFDQSPFRNRDVDPSRLEDWFRRCVEVRDEDGAERVLRTAVASLPEREVANAVFAAATDHRYLDGGHALDFCNKAFEALDHLDADGSEGAEGDRFGADVLASCVPALVGADRSEESAEWRQPVDLAALLSETFDGLPELVERGASETWTRPDGFTETLLGDDPHAAVDALAGAVRGGATATALAAEVAYAAALRVARFSTANEFGDWNTVHHTFTYANAVHAATERADTPALYRGVFDAAASVYLDRFLNVPPASVPAGDPDADPDTELDELRETFDVEGGVNDAGRAVADYLAGGGDPDRLVAELGGALLREDAGFHVLQNVEASVRQARTTDDDDRRRVFLLATARYLAAHTPTRREDEQTFAIATRLHRGERIHETSESE